MALIGKDTLVMEIKRMRDKAFSNSDWNHGYVKACESIISLLDTLEVKEMDLEHEINKVKKMKRNFEIKNDTIIDFCAKHFFELGLKAKGE